MRWRELRCPFTKCHAHEARPEISKLVPSFRSGPSTRRSKAGQTLPQPGHREIEKSAKPERHDVSGNMNDVHWERIDLDLLRDTFGLPALIAAAASCSRTRVAPMPSIAESMAASGDDTSSLGMASIAETSPVSALRKRHGDRASASRSASRPGWRGRSTTLSTSCANC